MRDIFQIPFATIYDLYLKKITRKGRTKEELDCVIQWLCGYDTPAMQEIILSQKTLKDFFDSAKLNPNACLIAGVICGYRVEEITDRQMQEVRYLDKLVDELAKGRALEKIMRQQSS